MMKQSVWIAYALMCFASANALADTLNDLDIYKRCFVRMVRTVPDPVNDAIYKSVAAGTVTGPQGCMQLFDTAAFNTTGVLTMRSNEQSRRIVKTFNDFHRTFFSSRRPTQLTNPGLIIADMEEPALYYTRALFQAKAGSVATKFSDIVTLSNGLSGVRDRTSGVPVANNFLAQKLVTYTATETFASSTTDHLILQYNDDSVDSKGRLSIVVTPLNVPDANLVQTGELVGVRAAVPLIMPNYLLSTDPTVRSATEAAIGNFNGNDHFGGGIIGSQGFLNANFNLGQGVLPLDVMNINRRTSSRIFSDLLCEQEPTLTAADVQAEVEPSSTYTFQQSVSCMQCHSSNDNAAMTLNHLVAFRSATPTETVGKPFAGIGALPEAADAAATTPFSLRKTSQMGAYLHYRENLSSGDAIKQPVSSIADMGAKIAGGNDLYLCAAKRYYKFLTGVDVALTGLATSDIDKQHQNFVIKLGQNLKKSQSLRTMIQQIVSSPQFAARNYMISESQ